MSSQLHYEEIEVGTEITPLVKLPTTQQLVKWAGASEDFTPIHYDKDIAQEQGLPGVIVHGRLRGAFLTQMLTDWVGAQGFIRKISIQQRSMDYPGQAMVCKGRVTRKHIENGDHCADCEIWTENNKGERTTAGTATVMVARGA